MNDETKNKIYNSLLFHESDVWNSVMLILDDVLELEVNQAIAQQTDETKRSHQCGRVDGIKYFKELLVNTREQSLILARRKSVDK